MDCIWIPRISLHETFMHNRVAGVFSLQQGTRSRARCRARLGGASTGTVGADKIDWMERRCGSTGSRSRHWRCDATVVSERRVPSVAGRRVRRFQRARLCENRLDTARRRDRRERTDLPHGNTCCRDRCCCASRVPSVLVLPVTGHHRHSMGVAQAAEGRGGTPDKQGRIKSSSQPT